MKHYSLNFWLLSLSSFLFFGSFNLVLPILPSFMRTFGGGDYVGLHITFFTLTALISRPFSGKLTDTWGRIPVMLVGAVVTAIVSLLYPFFLNIYAFLFIRFLHGFSTGFKPTGTAAYVADIVPVDRRGEGMGILSFFGMTGMGIGSYIGGEMSIHYSLDTIFFASGFVAFSSILVLMGMRETLQERQKFSPKLLKVNFSDLYEPTVLTPTIVMMLVTFSFGAVIALGPDISESLGIRNTGLYMIYFTFTSLISRVIGGKMSDKFGRRIVLMVAMIIVSAGALYIGLAASPWALFIGAMIFGAGYGLSSPAIFAWATDLAPDEFRGRGFSTVFMALEIGIGMGALLSGMFYKGNIENIPLIFTSAASLSLSAFVFLIFKKK